MNSIFYFLVPVASSWFEIELFDEVKHKVNNTIHQLLDRMDQELQQGSGLVFRAILTLDINISKINIGASHSAKKISKLCDTDIASQLSNSTFGHNLEFNLSHFYKRKFKDKMNTILDIKNSNDWCFVYALAAFLHQSKFETLSEKEDANSYKELIENSFNLTDIKFPIQFNDIQKFINQNEHLNLSLNIYTVKEDQLQLVFSNVVSEKNPGSENVNLLALFPKDENGENGENLPPAHFVLINKIENLMGEKDPSGRCRPKAICHLCHMKFTSSTSEKFIKHKKFCTNVRSQRQDLPDKGYKLKFDKSDYDKQYLNEYVIFYDLECILKNTEKNDKCAKCRSICKCPEERRRYAEIHQSHVPTMYSYCIIDATGKIVEQKTKYCAAGDAATRLVNRLLNRQEKYIKAMTGDMDKIHLSENQKKLILKKQNNRCRHCRKKVKYGIDDLVVDHSHFSGEIHGMAHNGSFSFMTGSII